MRRLYFIGVSTSGSSIMAIFPAWMAALGIDADIVGIDVPVRAAADRLRGALSTVRSDAQAAGALVTTHKAALFAACRQDFDELDPLAQRCQEVSCIATRSGRLLGWAKDPLTSRQAYTELLGPDPWARGSTDVVCLGVGGSGLALAVAVLDRENQPGRLALIDREQARLDVAAEVIATLAPRAVVEYHIADDIASADELVSSAAAGSLVVNATGMGKDLPGSPLSPEVVFPGRAVAWDMNYRGDLVFLDIARAQQDERRLTVADGWDYFLRGWTEVISEIFEVEIGPAQFAIMADMADTITGRTALTAGAGRG